MADQDFEIGPVKLIEVNIARTETLQALVGGAD
jgi:hypothetical protein